VIIITSPPEKFSGKLDLPGDKSITHRALMLGALAHGTTEVRGYLDAEDCRSTITCLQSLGVNISIRSDRLFIEGRKMKLNEPAGFLDAGNSGTTARLLLGILAGQSFCTGITGDLSLKRRPMKRVVDPLCLMGASFTNEGDRDHLPLTICGGTLKPINYKTPKASAQVKSAILLAALFAEGITTVEEPYKSRNHTELMLDHFGAKVQADSCRVTLQGRPSLKGSQIRVPGDISAAAFFMVAAAIIPGSEVLLKNVGVNPTRSGIVDVLRSMGTEIEIQQEILSGKEPVADILIRGGAALKGVKIDGEMIPRVIDEIPVLAVAAALAEGKTIISDASELRVKESDRLSALAGQLARLGAMIKETEDGMIIDGGVKLHGSDVDSCGDHRIAMALAVAGLAADGETAVHGAEVIKVSFPGFMQAMRSLIQK
jgi:3-phosphoshikimate 1-carboxyvinyltransferase